MKEGNVSIVRLELSEEAQDCLAAAHEKAERACELGAYGDVPATCPFKFTCITLVLVDRWCEENEHPEDAKGIQQEIRTGYDNKRCSTVCSLNVLNPGCLPDIPVEVGSYVPPRFPIG